MERGAPIGYVTRQELDAIIAKEWERLGARLEQVICDAMTACARSWLPDNPAHIADAAAFLGCISEIRRDDFVAAVEAGIVEKLRKNARPH